MCLLTTRRFERDLRRMRKRGKDIARLEQTVRMLLEGEPLPSAMRPHRLSGTWDGFWECHLEPDWLLNWQQDEDALKLVRTGSHSDLFG